EGLLLRDWSAVLNLGPRQCWHGGLPPPGPLGEGGSGPAGSRTLLRVGVTPRCSSRLPIRLSPCSPWARAPVALVRGVVGRGQCRVSRPGSVRAIAIKLIKKRGPAALIGITVPQKLR